MPQSDCFGTGYKDMVMSLRFGSRVVAVDADLCPASQEIYFVKCHPIADFVLITLKNSFAEEHIEINQLTACPAIIDIRKIHRSVKMIDSNDRFNSIFFAFIKYFVIEPETFFVDVIHSVRANAGPDDGHSETFESHFGKESDIFLVVMVEVRGYMTGIIQVRIDVAGSSGRQRLLLGHFF